MSKVDNHTENLYTLSTDVLCEGIVSIVIQIRENTWAIRGIWSTVLAVYRVRLITWSQRAKNFKISKNLAKFGLWHK